MKRLLVFIAVVGLVLLVVWKGVNGVQTNEEVVVQLGDDIALYMQDQKVSRTMTVAIVSLTSPGFVVIREMHEGEAGAVVGSTALLVNGRSEDVGLTLMRKPAEAETFTAMVYSDTNGNGAFDADVDQPMLDKAKNRVFAIFTTKAQ